MSVSVTSLTYVTSPIVTKVSVLSNLRISGCELKKQLLYILLFKATFYPCVGISVILSTNAGFLSPVRVTHFTQFEKGILCSKS